MDGGNEQRVVMKVCFKADLSATETLVLVQKAYGNEGLKRSNVFRLYSRFRDGRELVEEDERGMEETVMVYFRVRYKHPAWRKRSFL
jgi:hypothetical protein